MSVALLQGGFALLIAVLFLVPILKKLKYVLTLWIISSQSVTKILITSIFSLESHIFTFFFAATQTE